MAGHYSIGGIAKAAGVPASTVRYYERRGLLVADGRTRARYRMYGEAALERLRFIRAAQFSGFTLEDIASLLTLRDAEHADHCRDAVQSMIAERLAAVEAKMCDLKRVRRDLVDALTTCRSASQGVGQCPVLAQLTVQKVAPSA